MSTSINAPGRVGATVHSVSAHHGNTGRTTVHATYQFPSDELPRTLSFQASPGGPVMMFGHPVGSVTVTEPQRFGDFHSDPETWAHRFFAGS